MIASIKFAKKRAEEVPVLFRTNALSSLDDHPVEIHLHNIAGNNFSHLGLTIDETLKLVEQLSAILDMFGVKQ